MAGQPKRDDAESGPPRRPDAQTVPALRQDRDALVASLARSIAAELGVAMGSAERVGADCARLRLALHAPPTEVEFGHLVELAGLLAGGVSAVALPLADLVEQAATDCADPWPLLEGMIAAARQDILRRGLECAARRAAAGGWHAGDRVVRFLAEQADREGSWLREPEALHLVARILDSAPAPSPGSPGSAPTRPAGGTGAVLDLLLSGTESQRRLAARVLDLDGEPAPRDLRERLLGREAHALVGDYLDYTRASHLDLVHLQPEPHGAVRLAAPLAVAERQCGKALLREVIADLGWPRVNLGIEVHPRVGVSIGGSFPFMVTPAEAQLLESSGDARRTSETYLVIAQGGSGAPAGDLAARDPIERFRSYSLAHAQLLADFLDVAPPTRPMVRRILERMDGIVAGFAALFTPFTDECPVVAGVYRGLRERIARELEGEGRDDQLSAELTRLVLSFDDPRAPGDVRTLHGLKRYLHQRSLQLAFRLARAGSGTNRTVDVVLASRSRVLRRLRTVHYADFDPETRETASTAPPYPVRLLVEAFGRSLLHGRQSFPGVRVFLYGSEVHYFVGFGTHPALLRVNYAPPLQGGMLDLQFFGVSKYELSAHPNPTLEGLGQLLRRLDLDYRIENTHVEARYDKERALDLGDLCEKVESLAGTLPYLMDLDWALGDLVLDAAARAAVARAWAEWFAHWGVLPLEQILTRDRRGILAAVEAGPASETEVAWRGEGPYQDRFSATQPRALPAGLRAALSALGLDPAPLLDDDRRALGQLRLEGSLLRPLRAALARGELTVSRHRLHRRPPETYQVEHEAGLFAEILAAGDGRLPGAAAVARTIEPFARLLRFQTTGTINGYEVQSASLPLPGDALRVSVLRDSAGILQFGLFVHGSALGRSRVRKVDAWRSNARIDAADLGVLLRRSSYVAPGAEAAPAPTVEEAAHAAEPFRSPNPATLARPEAGERVVIGLRASPGRVVGRALFGTAGRLPEELDQAILVAASLRPDDSAFLYRAAGVVSTGGGVLSHVGLLAMQFRKPALIVPGQWERDGEGRLALRYRTVEFRLEERDIAGFRVAVHRDLREPEHRLREGDLVVLDADAGTLRVLGQDPEALALHDELHSHVEAMRRLAVAADPAEVLALRGSKLRARHQLVRILSGLASPELARHAVRELLAARGPSGREIAGEERVHLLLPLLGNPRVGRAARDCLVETARGLAQGVQASWARARQRIPALSSLYEVLASRLEILRAQETLADAAALLSAAGPDGRNLPPPDLGDLDGVTASRLREQRAERTEDLGRREARARGAAGFRHALRELERLDEVLGTPESEREEVRRLRAGLERRDEEGRARLAARLVVWPADGGTELHPLVGWKAANLAEAERLEPCRVPPWFAVTHRAFTDVLRLPVEPPATGADARSPFGGEPPRPARPLGQWIERVLARGDLGHAEKSAQIRALWERVTLPEALAAEVKAAYRRLCEAGPGEARREEEEAEPFVSIRSSSREEDAEIAARAGEFDTFLFVRGGEQVVEHLKRAWSGLWTERAIHNRAVLGLNPADVGGGVIVQRMAWSRVSGVLVTCDVAHGEFSEMVVNAGLGLGEGVVSGAVAADHVFVAKTRDLAERPLRFRYVTADKREQVIFDRRAGAGTIRAPTLYHQRLRPALEYVELAELARLAARLEAGYGYPLDLEFGLEGARLWLLQVRPVPVLLSTVRETLEHHPLAGAAAVPAA